MAEFMQNVTIFVGTSKRLATRFEIETRHTADKAHLRVRFKPKGARTRWWCAEGRSKLVIVDGWDHPEFDELIRGFAEAPVEQLSPGVSVQWVTTTIVAGGEPTKSKYAQELEDYLATLDPARILLDTRRPSNALL
jgi:hypothetical protein